MQNHSEKRRDISRSILPATGRKSVRIDAATIKRHHRRFVRQSLHDSLHYEWEDFEGHVADDTNRPTGGGIGWDRTITNLMWSRRDRDKVGPIMRWARATAERLPGDDLDKYLHFKALLPDNLIGRHALSHIKFIFDLPEDTYRFRYRNWPTTEERARARAEEHEIFTALVRTVVETRHREFNAEFGGEPCLGLHDVERWVSEHLRREGVKVRVLAVAARNAR